MEKSDKKKVVGWAGIEPATNGLKGRCSTTELPTHPPPSWTEQTQCR